MKAESVGPAVRRNLNTSSVSFFRPGDGTAQDPPLTIEELGRRMDDQVGAKIERSLQNRRAEAVIDDDQDTLRVRDRHQGGDIGDFGQRIRRCFKKEELRFWPHRGFPGSDIGLRDEGGLDSETRHDGAEQLLRCAEQACRGDDVIAAAAQRHHQRENGRHSGSGGNTSLRTFQGGQAMLKSGNRRIGEARVHIAFFLARETRGGLRRRSEDKTRRQVQRFTVLVELATFLPGTHRQRLEGVFWAGLHRLQPADIRFNCNCLDARRSSFVVVR